MHTHVVEPLLQVRDVKLEGPAEEGFVRHPRFYSAFALT